MSTYALRSEALLEARRLLLRHAEELRDAPLRPPVTGPSTAATSSVFALVAADVAHVVSALEGLAAGLAFVVDLAALTDGGVGALLDLLRGQAPR